MPTANLSDITQDAPDIASPRVGNISDIQADDHSTLGSDATDYLKQYEAGDPVITPSDAGLLHRATALGDEFQKASQAEVDATKGTPTWLRAARSVIGGAKQAGSNFYNWATTPSKPDVKSGSPEQEASTQAQIDELVKAGNTPEEAAQAVTESQGAVAAGNKTLELAQGIPIGIGKLPAIASNLAAGADELPITPQGITNSLLETIPSPIRQPMQERLAQERAAGDILTHYTNTAANDISEKTGISHDTLSSMIGENLALGLLPFGQAHSAEAMAAAVDRTANMIGNAVGGAKWTAAKAAPAAVGAAKAITIDAALKKLGISGGIDHIMSLWGGFGGKAMAGNAEIANKVATWFMGKPLSEVVDDAANLATKPMGMKNNEALASAVRQKATTLQEGVDGLKAGLETKDAKMVDELASDGSYKFPTEVLSKDAQQVREQMQQVADLNTKANAILKRNSLQKIFDDVIVRGGGNVLVHTAEGAAVGAAFTGAQAPTGDTEEAVGQGAVLGGALGLAASPFVTASGMRSLRMRKGRAALMARSEEAANVVGDGINIEDLSPEQQAYVKVLGGGVAFAGKRVYIHTPDNLAFKGGLGEGADPGHGFVDGNGDIHLNSDTIPVKAGNHEYTHFTQGIFGEMLGKLEPDQMSEFEGLYKDALASTGRQTFNSRKERDAEIGRLVLNNTPLELFYGGESGGDVVKRILGGLTGKGGIQHWGGFQVPYTKQDVSALRQRFFKAGELQTQLGQGLVKPPDVPYSQWTAENRVRFQNAREFYKQGWNMSDSESFKKAVDDLDFLPKPRPGQSREDQTQEAWDRYLQIQQQNYADKPDVSIKEPKPKWYDPTTFVEDARMRSLLPPKQRPKLEPYVEPKPEMKPFRSDKMYGWLTPEGTFEKNKGSDIHQDTIAKLLKNPELNKGSMGAAYRAGWDKGYLRLRTKGRDLFVNYAGGKIPELQQEAIKQLATEHGANRVYLDPSDYTQLNSKMWQNPGYEESHHDDWMPKLKEGQTREQADQDAWDRYYAQIQHQNEQRKQEAAESKATKSKWYDPTSFFEDARARSLLPPKQRPELEKYKPEPLPYPKEVYGWLDPKGKFVENEGGDIHADTITRLLNPSEDGYGHEYHDVYGGMGEAYHAGFRNKYLRLTSIGRDMYVHYPAEYGDIPKSQVKILQDIAEKHNMTSLIRDTEEGELRLWKSPRAHEERSYMDELRHEERRPWNPDQLDQGYRHGDLNMAGGSGDYMPKSPYYVERHGDVYAIVDRRRPSEVGLITANLDQANSRKAELDKSWQGRTSASGMWDSTFVEGEGAKERDAVSKELGVDKSKFFHEQPKDAQAKIKDYYKAQGADYMPKAQRELPPRFFVQPQMGQHDAIVDRLTGKIVDRWEGPDTGEYSSGMPYDSAQEMADHANQDMPPLPPNWTGPHPDAFIPELVRQHPDGTWGIDGPNNTIAGKFDTPEEANAALSEAHRSIYNPDTPTRLDYMPTFEENLDDKYPAPLVSAAIRMKDTGKITPGRSHIAAYIKNLQENRREDGIIQIPTKENLDEGFIDKNGEFLDRQQASARAEQIGQISPRYTRDKSGSGDYAHLTSEILNDNRDFMPEINVGMRKGEEGMIDQPDITDALAARGVTAVNPKVVPNTDEMTYTSGLSRALTPDEASQIADELGQDAIAQYTDDLQGGLYGPRAADWGEFDPSFFLSQEGKTGTPAFDYMPKSESDMKDYQKEMSRIFPEAIKPTFQKDKNDNFKIDKDTGEFVPEERPWAFDESPLYKESTKGIKDQATKDQAYSDALAQKIADEYKNKWSNDPMAMSAKGWYRVFTQKVAEKMGPENAELFAQLLSTTSPGNSALVNFKFALEAYNNYVSGRYDHVLSKFKDAYQKYKTGTLLDEKGNIVDKPGKFNQYMRDNNILALQQSGKKLGKYSLPVMFTLAGHFFERATGKKVIQFVKNLSGADISNPTIDLWAARTADRLSRDGYGDKPWRDLPQNESPVGDRDFDLAASAFKKAAQGLKLNVTDLQAIAWFGEKIGYGQRGWIRGGLGASLGDFRPYLKAATPKLGTLHELELPSGIKARYAPVTRIQ